ncbi:MAG: twin-arginine translocation signal domain-containing protein [Pseudomonadota bacterium]|nr:twin-arginine translocation signal domain-containing protein [Pseudomonadota bacterium]
MSVFTRRDFLKAATATTVLALADTSILAQDSLAPKPGITVGVWEVPAPGFGMGGDKSKPGVLGFAKKKLKQAAEATKQGIGLEHFAHTFLNVTDQKGQTFVVHALPMDTLKHEPRDFKNFDAAVMEVVVMTQAESEQLYNKLTTGWNHSYDRILPQPLANLESKPIAESLGKILDVALAVNQKKMPFPATPLDRTETTNDNPFTAAALAKLGLSRPEKSPELAALFSPTMLVPGANRGLLLEAGFQTIPPILETVGRAAPAETVVATFKTMNAANAGPSVPEVRPPAAEAPQLKK